MSDAPRTVRAAVGMGAITAVSRAVGFVRVLVVAAVLGISYLGNAFQSANSLSNVLFELLADLAAQPPSEDPRGMKVGIVSSTCITDATPAVFYAHQPYRGEQYADASNQTIVPDSTTVNASLGLRAGLVFVLVKTDPTADPRYKGMTCFIAEKEPGVHENTGDYAGFNVPPQLKKMGYKGVESTELVFDGYRCPAENILGGEEAGLNKGFSQMMDALEVGRVNVAARGVGIAQRALELGLRYSQERKTFGKPIAQHQAIQFKLADMATELEAARWLTYRAAALRDAGCPFLKEASMAKLKASRLAAAAASEAVQIHGGVGYMLESPVARFYCDSKVLEIGEGTNEIQHVVIARALGC